MRKPIAVLIASAAILAAVILVAAIGIQAALVGALPARAYQPSKSAPSHVVKIVNLSNGNYAFRPSWIKVKVGTKVTWNDVSNAEHTVTTSNPNFGITGISPHQKKSLTFKTVGTFKYHCSIHPYMKGTVKVVR